MMDFLTVKVPAYKFHFNLVVYPLPAAVKTVSIPFNYSSYTKFYVLRAEVGSTL